MKVWITGVHGFIGSHLARYLSGQGFSVYGSSRAENIRPDMQGVLAGYRRLSLGEPFDAAVFAGQDVLIYGAHALAGKEPGKTNIDGTRAWFSAAKDQGVKKQVFLTSYSAKPGSASGYGAVKYELEKFFAGEGQVVARPGLVLGRAGMFGRMMRMVRRYPVIPLLAGGDYRLPIISIDALCRAIEKTLQADLPLEYNLFQENPVTMRELLLEVKRQTGSRCLFLNIPSFIPLSALKLIEALHLPFPIKSESIVALKENQSISLPSSLPALGIRDKCLAEIVAGLV